MKLKDLGYSIQKDFPITELLQNCTPGFLAFPTSFRPVPGIPRQWGGPLSLYQQTQTTLLQKMVALGAHMCRA